jgi:RNA-directed DNA polymerase
VGTYAALTLQPLLIRSEGQRYPFRCPDDTARLKRLRADLARLLPKSPACTHLRGHGGAKAAVRRVHQALAGHRHVFRTDVRSYYASIDHFKLMDQLARHFSDRQALNLLWQYMRRAVEYGGTYRVRLEQLSKH